MNRRIAKATIAAIVLGATTALAGPTADRLSNMGAEVATPQQRPAPGGEFNKTKTLPNPLDGGSDDVTLSSAPQPARAQPVAKTVQSKPAAMPAASSPASACLAELQTFANAEQVNPPKADDPACTVENPVRLTATTGDAPISFSGKPILACNVALRFARFTADTAQPLARHHVGAKLTQVGTGPGFTCRRRNNAATGKLSEHAFGRGIDIISFSFDGKERMDVRTPKDMIDERAAFFTALRKAACGHFTTVLGPGSNAAHATHLHFDTGREDRGKKNPYRICQ